MHAFKKKVMKRKKWRLEVIPLVGYVSRFLKPKQMDELMTIL